MRISLALLFASLLFSACSSSNNVLLGRVEATVGNHDVVVTDCYRTSVPAPEKTGTTDYRWAPCKDANVVIREDELIVNGQSYGRVNPNDSVLVDHGRVSVEKGK
jgi:hypothetical protein